MSLIENVCPSCGSEDIYYSKKRKCFVCEDCEVTFEQNQTARNARSLFFSYGHDVNRVIVDRIKSDLEGLGFSVWIDYERIAPGNDWRSCITQGILSSNTVLAFLSSHSARKNGVCRDELRIALCERCAYIQPILLESPNSFTPPQNIAENQWIDMSEWRSFEIGSKAFDEWYSKKFKELTDVLMSKNISDLHGDISVLKEILTPALISTKEVALLKKDFVGRQWLFDLIQNQKSSSANCIYITGGAGTGKSALSANMQYYLDNIMGTWYCQWDDYKTTDSIYLIKTLAFKLAVCISEYRKYILSNSEKIKSVLVGENVSQIIEALIILPLQFTIDGNRECKFFLIDGLDEAEHNQKNDILDTLCALIPAMPNWIKFIVTSRESEHISRKMNLLNLYKIDLDNAQETKADFEDYCTNKFAISSDRIAEFKGNYLLLELCNKAKDPLNRNAPSLNSYYYASFVKQFENKEFTQEERLTFALLINAVSPIPTDTLLFVYAEDEDKYLKAIRKIKEYTVFSTETYKTFWMKRTLSIAHYSLQQWLLTEDAGKYQITKRESLKIVLDFYENLINEHSYCLTSSLLDNYETFLIRNGYFDILHAKKSDSRYLMIKERISISDNYSNKTNRIAHLDAEKIKKIDDLSHRISLTSVPVRYHATKPLIHHTGGAMDDYCEYYIFPCCGLLLASDGTPHAVTESGCHAYYGDAENLPDIIELSPQEEFEFWKLELIKALRGTSAIYQKAYTRIYNQTISNHDEWNELSKDEQDIILQTIKSSAEISSNHTIQYRTENIISRLSRLATKIGISETDLKNCIDDCKRTIRYL